MNIGPRNITNGLVFGYDVGSDFSYYGEPTTNILPSPEYNGRFATGNGWGTYNTNQYCGNNGCANYWTIPSISSVSSNIITTSSAHQIRSFDVIRANASGGGITAGVDYVAKKISDTQFSLHEYNGSQDGSQGYINPSTGFFKVHDAYANDTRISVSASGFPTGWWGAPHLPNSGLIKEIVTGGGRVPGTNCMRLHAYRPDGVVDGMAYGVYTPVTGGQVITLSFWHKAASPTSVGQSCGWSSYFGGNGAPSGAFTLGENWQKYQLTWTASVSYSFILYFWPPALSTFDMADMQVEVKDHATKFTLGTRSATASIRDMSSNNATIDVSNVSFDANNNITFDGSNDYITLTTSQIPTSQITIEFICTNNGSSNNTSIIAGGAGGNQDFNIHLPWGDGNVYWDFGRPFTRIYKGTTSAERTGVHHWVFTKNPTTGIMNIYLDGNLWHTGSGNTSTLPTLTSISLGRYDNGSTRAYYYNGYIPVTKIYNRELSASEISQHYYSYKTRFGLS
jgi:hypothetical protein